MEPSQHSFSDLKCSISNHMSLLFESEGFSPLVGKIFALLLFAPEPLSLQEMADRLGVTKAAISVQVRALEKHAMCQRLATRSDRKDYYYIADDFTMTVARNTIQKIQSVQGQIQSTLNVLAFIQDIKAEEEASHDAFKRRFIEMDALYQAYLTRLEGFEEEWKQKREQIMLQFKNEM